MFKFSFLLICFLMHSACLYAQQTELLTPLSTDVNETSGLLFLNQKIITHNDSGGEPALYEIDSISGNVNRKVIIDNATNVDWEDVTSDDNYIYIGDFGNNAGSRTDLKVYRLSQNDFFNTPNDTVSVDTITFNYANQIDFTPTSYSTNFDAEAFVAFNDSLYIFTKNWGDNKTNIYALPKIPGDYQIEKLDSINSMGLVTGAAVSNNGGSVVLCGYAGVVPFIVELNQVIQSNFSGSAIERYDVVQPAGYSVQIEGIVSINPTQYYLSSERFLTGTPSGLYKLTKNASVGIPETETPEVNVFPNPATKSLNIEMLAYQSAVLVSVSGDIVRFCQFEKGLNIIDLNGIESGEYVLKFKESGAERKITIQD